MTTYVVGALIEGNEMHLEQIEASSALEAIWRHTCLKDSAKDFAAECKKEDSYFSETCEDACWWLLEYGEIQAAVLEVSV